MFVEHLTVLKLPSLGNCCTHCGTTRFNEIRPAFASRVFLPNTNRHEARGQAVFALLLLGQELRVTTDVCQFVLSI
jgi:hypothetical protein